ncbi:glycosyltransferase [Agarivorans aestuarii]|uniref:glycosyltransferase n=1 Tax=Agarivorans aestuarii TaxID=1563703 RepID=UPI001C821BB8|nr:glycosyltransferase [Agarivorans aestuarii]
MTKKILLVGDANHQFNYYLSKYLKSELSYEVAIYSFSKPKKNSAHHYDNIYYSKLANLNKFFLLIMMYMNILFFQRYYDYISIQFVRNVFFYLLKLPFINKRKFVISIWGSDILESETPLSNINYILDSSHKITCATDVVKLRVERLTKTKVCIIKYGLQPLENIRASTLKKADAKREFGISPSTLTIAIGYNGSSRQKHIECVDSLLKGFDTNELNDITLIFPISYGRNENHISALKKHCSNHNLNSLFIDDFLSDHEMANLRICSDIFVNVQPTDMFSGAMQEHIYAGSRVICGEWLEYPDIKSNGITVETISSISELARSIKTVGVFYDKRNAKKIYSISSWLVAIEAWDRVFHD